jgi:hypothetical protein
VKHPRYCCLPVYTSVSVHFCQHICPHSTKSIVLHVAQSLPSPPRMPSSINLTFFFTTSPLPFPFHLCYLFQLLYIQPYRIVSYPIESYRIVSNHILSHPGIATYSTLIFPSLLLYSRQTVCTTPPASPKGSQARSLAHPLSSGKVVGEGGGGGGYLDLRRVRQRRRSFNEGVCESGTGIGASRDAESCQIASSPHSPSPHSPSPHSPSPSKTLSRPRSRSRSRSQSP